MLLQVLDLYVSLYVVGQIYNINKTGYDNMNSKIFLILLLFGIVLSVSTVSAVLINDNGADLNDDVLKTTNYFQKHYPHLHDDVPIFTIDGKHPHPPSTVIETVPDDVTA